MDDCAEWTRREGVVYVFPFLKKLRNVVDVLIRKVRGAPSF
jgi:hypothetical protein